MLEKKDKIQLKQTGDHITISWNDQKNQTIKVHFAGVVRVMIVHRCSSKCVFLKVWQKFIGKHLCWSLFLIKSQALRPETLLKTDSNTSVFLRNLRTCLEQLFTEHFRWLLLKIMNSSSYLRNLPIVYYKTFSPVFLQELINNLAVCKPVVGHLLVEDLSRSHGFGNQNYIFQKGAALFNRSTQNMPHFYVTLHKVSIF